MTNKFYYDFEKLQTGFEFMTNDQIIQEWLKLSVLHNQMMACDLDTVHEYCEPIDKAREFLGFYLANLFCITSGYRIDSGDI